MNPLNIISKGFLSLQSVQKFVVFAGQQDDISIESPSIVGITANSTITADIDLITTTPNEISIQTVSGSISAEIERTDNLEAYL